MGRDAPSAGVPARHPEHHAIPLGYQRWCGKTDTPSWIAAPARFPGVDASYVDTHDHPDGPWTTPSTDVTHAAD